MSKFVSICIAEIRRSKKNYYSSLSSFFSLLIWPLLNLVTIYYTYHSFKISNLHKFGIENKKTLFLFLLIGSLVYNCFFNMLQGGLQVTNEKINGTIEIAYMSPANRLAIAYGRSLGGIFETFWILIIYILAIIFCGIDNISLFVCLEIIFSVVILILASMIWGGFIYSIFFMNRDTKFIFTAISLPMSFFGGVNFPIDIFPRSLKWISFLYPITYTVSFMRSLYINAEIKWLIGNIAINVVFCVITIHLLRRGEKIHLEKGTINDY